MSTGLPRQGRCPRRFLRALLLAVGGSGCIMPSDDFGPEGGTDGTGGGPTGGPGGDSGGDSEGAPHCASPPTEQAGEQDLGLVERGVSRSIRAELAPGGELVARATIPPNAHVWEEGWEGDEAELGPQAAVWSEGPLLATCVEVQCLGATDAVTGLCGTTSADPSGPVVTCCGRGQVTLEYLCTWQDAVPPTVPLRVTVMGTDVCTPLELHVQLGEG